jgi:hypothetical protein
VRDSPQIGKKWKANVSKCWKGHLFPKTDDPVRVTRLGEFLPLGRFITWQVFLKIAEVAKIFELFFSSDEV